MSRRVRNASWWWSMTAQVQVHFHPVAAELPQLPVAETLESDRGRTKSFGIGCPWNAKMVSGECETKVQTVRKHSGSTCVTSYKQVFRLTMSVDFFGPSLEAPRASPVPLPPKSPTISMSKNLKRSSSL